MSVTGGDLKKMKRFPGVLEYLKAKQPAVYQLFRDLGMQQSLVPRRGGGLTFLLPDATLVKKLTSLAESDHPEDAADLLQACILLDVFKSTAEFERKKDDIPNKLRQTLVVTGTKVGKVEVEGPGSIELDKAYVPFERMGGIERGNTAVWKLSGTVKLGTKPTSFKYQQKAANGKPAASEQMDEKVEGGFEDELTRLFVEQQQALTKAQTEGKEHECVFLRYYARVLNCLCSLAKSNDDAKKTYETARATLPRCPYTGLIMLLTAKTLFDQSIIRKCMIDESSDEEKPKDVVDHFNDTAVAGASAKVLNPEGLMAVTKAREDLIGDIVSVGPTAAKKILEAYKTLSASNKLGDEDGVYPDYVHNIFSSNENYKLMLDEFVCFVHKHIKVIIEERSQIEKAVEAFSNDFKTMYGGSLDPKSGYKSHYLKDDNEAKLGGADYTNGTVLPFINGFALRVPTNTATREYAESSHAAAYVIVGGDDDEDQAMDSAPMMGMGDGDLAMASASDANPHYGAFQKSVRRYAKKHGDEALMRLAKGKKHK